MQLHFYNATLFAEKLSHRYHSSKENDRRQHDCSESAKLTQYKMMQNNVIGHHEGTSVYKQSDLCYYAWNPPPQQKKSKESKEQVASWQLKQTKLYTERFRVNKHLMYRRANIWNMYNYTKWDVWCGKLWEEKMRRPTSPSVGHFRLNSEWGFIHAFFIQSKAIVQQILRYLKHEKKSLGNFAFTWNDFFM